LGRFRECSLKGRVTGEAATNIILLTLEYRG